MKKLLLSILAIFLIIEEWLWDLLSALGHYLIRQLHLEYIERWLIQTTPPIALLAVLVPILLVLPINLAALWFLIHAQIWPGILLEILSKLLGTLLVARVFALTKPQLLTFKAINIIYTTISDWLHWAHQKVVDTAIYQYAKQLKDKLKLRLKAIFSA
ncbi:hypothetical protein KEF85_16620 [Methylomonas paludis]|uniref:Uncharacterized protein n=1 Tax=Methylomonas paludis TaxID=1173101 RepID=A0A975MNI8_9GAMM|nr:hypothetical protein [Methylomonas paludis]QWF70905.1 hypothetical protein KEF85_16620 [Methylomonas paludis]